MISTRVSNDFFSSRCDQDPSAVKPMPEFDPNEQLYLLSPPENGSRSQRKVAKFKATASYHTLKTEKLKGS